MPGCCDDKSCAVEALRERQSGTLRIVLAINAVMFVVEATGGYLASSAALLSDSLDNLGDALTYGLSLYVVAGGGRAKAKVALIKGALIAAAALAVVVQIVYRLFVPATPLFEAMGGIALLALAANGTCLLLLWKHRMDDVNMMSVWECSRNDIASNFAVLIAAAAVGWLGSGWPDLLVAVALAALLIASAARVLRRAARELSAKPGIVSPGTIEILRK
jgi:Co/Zn/Cd efflux system component